jgi:hypothetical protein
VGLCSRQNVCDIPTANNDRMVIQDAGPVYRNDPAGINESICKLRVFWHQAKITKKSPAEAGLLNNCC